MRFILTIVISIIISSLLLPSPTFAHQVLGALPPMQAYLPKLPLIGDPAPEFEAESTAGHIRFPDDYKGKWVVLFSHPGDFTPVCTSEFIAFGAQAPEFERLGAALIGLSTDSLERHMKWRKSIREKITFQGTSGLDIPFPIVADEDHEIAWSYGMLHPSESGTQTVRAVFLIDPTGKIRSLLFYPHTAGRNIEEIKRLLIALQTSDSYRVATPANWNPGDDVLVPKPLESDPSEPDIICQTDYFCTQALPVLLRVSGE